MANVEVITGTVVLKALQTPNVKALINFGSLNHCKHIPRINFIFSIHSLLQKLPFVVRIRVAGAKMPSSFQMGLESETHSGTQFWRRKG